MSESLYEHRREESHHFYCPNSICGAYLGVTTAKFLIIGNTYFTRSVTFQCSACRRFVKWRPSAQQDGGESVERR